MLRRLLVACLATVSLVTPSFARTAPPDNRSVTAVGEAPIEGSVDTARNQAINQAKRAAVEQSVGVFVNSETKVQNFQVLSDSIYTKANGFVSDVKVLDEQKKGGTYWVKIAATVSVLPLAQQLKGLGVLRQWTIATVLKGSGYNKDALEAAESAVNRRLVDAGFRTADREVLIALDNPNLEKDMQKGNYAGVLAQLRDSGVDILVTGRASHERTAGAKVETYGGIMVDMSTVKARLDIKAIRADTGELVAADVFEDKAVGSGKDTISAQAVERAGVSAADFLIGSLIKLPAATSAPVQLAIRGLSFNRAKAFMQAVQETTGVRKVHQQRFGNGQAVYEVEFEGNASLLADVLSGSATLRPFKFDITNLSGGKIEAKAQ
ncbi:MAG: flagellar assembly protein T N-terminal domain-containing protein [Candidatus Sericytochromatia bacterium]|nr:flagellar assembly protein T N-terminal domain-containing protein [Candidatus Sericytochromatia bacterium]